MAAADSAGLLGTSRTSEPDLVVTSSRAGTNLRIQQNARDILSLVVRISWRRESLATEIIATCCRPGRRGATRSALFCSGREAQRDRRRVRAAAPPRPFEIERVMNRPAPALSGVPYRPGMAPVIPGWSAIEIAVESLSAARVCARDRWVTECAETHNLRDQRWYRPPGTGDIGREWHRKLCADIQRHPSGEPECSRTFLSWFAHEYSNTCNSPGYREMKHGGDRQ